MAILFQQLIVRGLMVNVVANDDCQPSHILPFRSDYTKLHFIQKESRFIIKKQVVYFLSVCLK